MSTQGNSASGATNEFDLKSCSRMTSGASSSLGALGQVAGAQNKSYLTSSSSSSAFSAPCGQDTSAGAHATSHLSSGYSSFLSSDAHGYYAGNSAAQAAGQSISNTSNSTSNSSSFLASSGYSTFLPTGDAHGYYGANSNVQSGQSSLNTSSFLGSSLLSYPQLYSGLMSGVSGNGNAGGQDTNLFNSGVGAAGHHAADSVWRPY